MNRKLKDPAIRIFCVAAVFILICAVYFIKMFNIVANADRGDNIDTGTYERREPIQALRGEIFDRDGTVLVYNEYTYNMVFDYDAMAATQIDRNYAILQAV